MQDNGYPSKNIQLTISQQDKTPAEQPKESVNLPYLGAVSHSIERILLQASIKTYYTTPSKLYQQLFTHKDKTGKDKKPAIYRIPCECSLVYIEKTGRNFTNRLKEHLGCCPKGHTEKSSVAKHTWATNHRILWTEASLICTESNYSSR